MSKILKDFMKRRGTPAGDLDQLAQNYIKNNWSNMEQCILNGKTIYMLADTQAGKTRYKLWLADYALSKGIVDNVVISTTNLTGAMTQMFDRAVDWGKQIGRQVKSTTDKSAYMVKGDIFVNMTNANRTNRIDAIVADAEKTAKQTNRSTPRILVIIDEGEEFHECTQVSQCDIALTNLLLSRKGTVSTVKVSATLLSHLMIHGQFSTDLGYLSKEQIYRIPNHPDYQGLNKKDFIEPVLSIESNFSGDTYTKSANLRNTLNPQRVVNEVELLITNNNLVQIGNVVFGRQRSGHTKVAGMLTRAFQNKGRTVTMWDDEDFNQLNTSSEIVVIVHNGHARDLTVAEKLTAIAHGWNRTELKAILIISKMMTGKSITVECEHWYDPKSPEFGFYANFTAYYGPGKENITTAIQAMRCTGIRPALKKNVMWTTDDTKQDIENYRDQITQFIAHLNKVGAMNETQIIKWVAGTRPITKANVQKYIGNTGRKSLAQDIGNNERHLATEADCLIPISATEYRSIGQNVNLAIDYALQHGFTPVSMKSSEWEGPRQDRAYKDAENARMAFKNHTAGKEVKLHWVKLKNRYYLYVKNKMSNELRVEYNINDLVNGRPSFSDSRIYQGKEDYTYKVT
jgi:hypothetical protein